MLEAVSALDAASFNGFARIEEAGLRGMITLRGDLGSTGVKNAATGVAGVDMPGRREANCVGEKGIAWMSPDELLVLVPYAEAEHAAGVISRALAGEHALVANVSDARAMFYVSGDGAREVLAKLSPADMHPETFRPGQIRRTRLAQVPAGFWMRDTETFEVICFRSVADYVFGLLKNAAQPGSEIGYF
ncbi:MAG: sarcosine oxidase subunit gamma [Alphaproteobacteria bacterium]|nr:sarcosine oxidase subunit gamma [Alphaproteobacteria bacterium]NNF25056.1 sarcosine oxidase subunit gamma [Paracoccaceae bacterium]